LAINISSVTSKSIVALSVSIKAIEEPSETFYPSETIHFVIFPSVIVGENAGSFIGIVENLNRFILILLNYISLIF
jgi:hypothetical protein